MIKIFADGGSLGDIEEMNENKNISGFTSNPTLMRKAGVSDYLGFIYDALKIVKSKPFSFEVLSDDLAEMERQAVKISEFGDNVYVKIPVTNSRGDDTYSLMSKLSMMGIKINATAITTFGQIQAVSNSLNNHAPSIISVFCGRIADAGMNPVNHILYALEKSSVYKKQEVLWASTREIYNYVQAKNAMAHIITMPKDLIKKIDGIGRNLEDVSLDTVRMFLRDSNESGFSI